MPVEFTKDSTDLVNEMISKPSWPFDFCPHFIFLNIFGCSKYQLSGPMVEKLKIAVNYNSINNLDVSSLPVR